MGVLAAAALFSTGGAAIKVCGLSGWQVASLRSGLAALFLFAAIPAARRGWSRSTFLVGAAQALTLVLFVRANKLTTAASTIFLQSTAPLYVLLASHWLLKERIRRRDVAFLVALALGLGLLLLGTDGAPATAPDPATGNLLAALSGAFWGLTIVGLRFVGRGRALRDDAVVAPAALGNLLACALSLPWVFPLAATRPVDWLVLAYLGIAQVGVAYVLLTRSLRQVRALEAALLLLLEPVLNPVWAWILQGETPGAWTLAGGGLILAATVAHSVSASNDATPGSTPEPKALP